MLQKQQRYSWGISFKDGDGRALEVEAQLLEEKLNSQELVIDEDAMLGWLVPLLPSHKPDSPQRGASKSSAGCLVRVPSASASVKEVFIRVGHERKALKIIQGWRAVPLNYSQSHAM